MTTARTLHVLALSAGLSTPSSTRLLTDLLTGAARDALSAQGAEVEVRTVEAREYAREATEAMLSGFPGERLTALIREIRGADAVVAVSPIFNTGASGLFKTLIDVLPMDVWAGTPVLLGATAGTARHSLALEYAIRPMFVFLKAEIVPTAVFAASADFGITPRGEGDEQPLAARARRAGRELAALLGGPSRVPIDASTEGEAVPGEGADDASAPNAAGPGATGTDAARAPGRDPEFSDFTPMDDLLRHG